MSELQRIIDMLSDTDSALMQSSGAGDSTVDDIIAINNASIQKRRLDLVRRLDNVLHIQQNQYVSYRVNRTWTDEYPVKAIASAVSAFQDLVTAVFDAVRYGPKIRFRPSPDSVELSSFQFAGASTGSVIVSMAVPSERLLLGENEIERALELVERAISARESEDLQLLAQEIGIAAITKTFVWAQANVDYRLDTEIAWGRSFDADHRVAVTHEESETVRDLIAQKSDASEEQVSVDCVLVGFDGDTSYFHIETIGENTDIRGALGDGISKTWVTSTPYHAVLRKKVQVQYSTGRETEAWTLLDLLPLELPKQL